VPVATKSVSIAVPVPVPMLFAVNISPTVFDVAPHTVQSVVPAVSIIYCL
jgi:hypothetical protein